MSLMFEFFESYLNFKSQKPGLRFYILNYIIRLIISFFYLRISISFLNLPITIISLLIYFWTIAILTSCNLFDTNCFFPYMLNKFQNDLLSLNTPYMLNKFQNDLLSLNTQFHKIVAAYHRRLINT